jgi:hypothetical protein
MPTNTALETLVTAVTACRSSAELFRSMDHHGYVPSLRADRNMTLALGQMIEATGRRHGSQDPAPRKGPGLRQ